MKTRIIVAVIGIPLLLVVLLLLPDYATAILVAAMSAVGAYELLYPTKTVRQIPVVALCSIMGVFVTIWCYSGSSSAFIHPAVIVFVLLLFLFLLKNHTELRFDQLCTGFFAGIVLPYLLNALTRIQLLEQGRYLILVPFVAAFASDSGAYFVGCAIGKHKLAPAISPKKTIEGAIGGLACGILGMLAYALVLDLAFDLRINYLYAVLYGFAGACVCIIGDLAFSVMKRQTGIKDYGNILPGHGGVLDRFDSMTLVAPVMEGFMIWLPIIVK